MAVKHKSSHPASDAFSSDLEELSDNFSQLRSNAKQLARTALDSGQDGVKAVREKAVQGVQRGISNLKDMRDNTIDSIGDRIAAKPFTSLLIAVGVGFIWAKWMRRR